MTIVEARASLGRGPWRTGAVRAPARAPLLSVVIPATDRAPTLPRCLRAVRAAVEARDEVIVVDGPARLSAAAARNAGAHRATREVVVFVDADVEVRPDALARIRAAFDGRSDLVAIFGAYDDAPGAAGVVTGFRNLLHHHVHATGAGPSSSFWTGLGAVRRAAFEASGGFDEERFPHPSVEDIELGLRLVRSGAAIELDPRIQGKHLKAWTVRQMVHTDFARRALPWMDLLLTARACTSELNMGWRHRLSALACAVAAGAAVVRRPVPLLTSTLALVMLNRPFYAVLLDRRGGTEATAGVALHALHHLTWMAALPVAVAIHAAGSATGRLSEQWPWSTASRPRPAPPGATDSRCARSDG